MTESDLLVGEKIWQESTSTEYQRPWEAPLLPTNPHVLNHQLVMTYNVPTGHISTSNQKHFALSAPSTNALSTSSPPHNEPVHRAVQWVDAFALNPTQPFPVQCTVCTVQSYVHVHQCPTHPTVNLYQSVQCVDVQRSVTLNSPGSLNMATHTARTQPTLLLLPASLYNPFYLLLFSITTLLFPWHGLTQNPFPSTSFFAAVLILKHCSKQYSSPNFPSSVFCLLFYISFLS